MAIASPLKNFTFKNSGERAINDIILPELFEFKGSKYSFTIHPKSEVWRLGIRLSTSPTIEFYDTPPRHRNSNFPDIHIGAGMPVSNSWDWGRTNEFHLVNYYLQEKHDLDRQYTYKEFGTVEWMIEYGQEEGILEISCTAEGCKPFSTELNITQSYKYFKLFAWADKIDFELDCSIDETSDVKEQETRLSGKSFTIENVTFRLGDIFDSDVLNVSDLVVLPAASNGSVSFNIEEAAIKRNIPLPKEKNHEGDVDVFEIETATPRFWGWAFSVPGNYNSDKELIWHVCGRLRNEIPKTAETVSIPMFGTGAGGLDPSEVAPIFIAAFKDISNCRFIVNILVEEVYDQIREQFLGKGDTNFEKTKEKVYKNLQNYLVSDEYVSLEKDALGFQTFADTISGLLMEGKTKPPLNIAVIAPWGRGKTSLMRMIKNHFDECRFDLLHQGEIELNEKLDSARKNLQSKSFQSLDEKVELEKKIQLDSLKLAELQKQNSKPAMLRDLRNWLKMFGKNNGDLIDNVEQMGKEILKKSKLFFNNAKNGKVNPLHNSRKVPFATVWFNPWNYQSSEMIWAGLAHAIVNQIVEQLPSRIEREEFWFKLKLARIDKQKLRQELHIRIVYIALTIIGILAAILFFVLYFTLHYSMFIPISAVTGAVGIYNAVMTYLKPNNKTVSETFSNLTQPPNYEQKLGLFHEVNEDMKKVIDMLVDEKKPPVIFVDDLDRCSPSKVVEVVEAINVFMSGEFNAKCYFIIGMDAQIVAASLDVAYEKMKGQIKRQETEQGSIGWYFLDKFIQLPFFIPILDKGKKEFFLNKILAQTRDSQVENEFVLGLEKNSLQDQQNEQKAALLEENLSKENDPNKKREIVQSQDKEVVEKFNKKIVTEQIKRTEDDPEIKEQVAVYAEFLGSDPRSLKRFVNLLRFYSSYQELRSKKGETHVQVKTLAKWLAIMLRFPMMVRWIQWEDDNGSSTQYSSKEKAVILDQFLLKVCKRGHWEQEYEEWLAQDAKFLIPTTEVNRSLIKDLDEKHWLKSKTFFQIIQKDFENDSLLENALNCNVW